MKILKYTLIVALLSLLSRIVGFAREAIIANNLGVSYEADAIYLALTIPNIFQFVLGASIANALIPHMERAKLKHNSTTHIAYFYRVTAIFSIILILVSVVIFLFSHQITTFLAPDLNDETNEFTQILIVSVLPAAILISISTVFQQVLQMEEKVLFSNIGPILLNLTIVIFMVLFSSEITTSYSLILGMIIGSIITIIFQYFSLKNLGYKKMGIDLKKEEIKEVFLIAVTIMIGLLINQMYNIINRFLASSLMAGSISALSYGERIIQLPVGIIAQSLGIVIFPILSKFATNKMSGDFNELVIKSFKIIIIITLPISILIFIFSEGIVTILFGRGEFDAPAILITASILKMFAFILIGQSLIMILTRVYYAIQKPKIPLYTIIITLILNVFLSITLKNLMGAAGIALANTISMNFNALLLVFLLKYQGINLKVKYNFVFLKLLFVIIIFTLVAMLYAKITLSSILILDLSIKSLTLSLIYIFFLILIKNDEVLILLKMLRNRFKKL